MGKIRSTLDIVMERTKGLSMSRDAKKDLRHKELSDAARAAVRKYLDSRATLRDLSAELDSAGEDRTELLALVKRDLLDQLQVDGENGRVIDALENLAGADRGTLEGRIRDCRSRLDAEMVRQLEELKAGLETRGIRGRAVVPNIAASGSWRDTLSRARRALADELESLL